MKKNIAIVTGASSGLGKEFVKLLLEKKRLKKYGQSQEIQRN